MHIIIGIISALAGLFWALNSLERSGFRLSSLNPFHWHRRNQWKKQNQASPLYLLDNPMDAAAAMMLGIAKLEGEISREHKNEILNIFSKEFNLDSKKAKELLASTSYLLQSENNFIMNIGKVLSASKDKYSPEQAESTIALMTRIAKIESDISPEQSELLGSVSKILKPLSIKQEKW
jgi:uncharacterized tellurite resistance protein B-like protein